MQRRTFLLGAAGTLGSACAPRLAWANVPQPYSWDISPPMNSREAYVGWMVANRGEEPRFLGQHWARYEALLRNKDVLDERNTRAFLLVIVPFVPFTKLEGDAIKGTHNNPK